MIPNISIITKIENKSFLGKRKKLSEYLLCAKFSGHRNKQDQVPALLELTYILGGVQEDRNISMNKLNDSVKN